MDPSAQPSKKRRIFINTHENLFDSDERLDNFDILKFNLMLEVQHRSKKSDLNKLYEFFET